jgi:hypothetical protein
MYGKPRVSRTLTIILGATPTRADFIHNLIVLNTDIVGTVRSDLRSLGDGLGFSRASGSVKLFFCIHGDYTFSLALSLYGT